LRGERIAKKIYLERLKELLRTKDIKTSVATISRWESSLVNPSLEVIKIWAECLDLKMSVFIDSPEHRLVKGDWLEKLKVLRKDRNITIEQINRCIGVNPWTVSLWEKRLKSPNESELKAWATALGATACLVFEEI
jgi:transcriptional regulator with XRE-family HTH domain